MQEWLGWELWNNTLADYLMAGGIFVGLVIFFRLVQSVIISRLRRLADRTTTRIDNALVEIISSLRPPVYFFLAFYFAFRSLQISGFVQEVLDAMLLILIVMQVIIAANILVDYLVRKWTVSEDSLEAQTALDTLGKITKAVFWIVGVLFFLSNQGINIASLVAGLGVGGIAIAFALQNILGDLFSSFAIYFDKPFVVGDFIIVGEHLGTVERVGLKTTRIRALQGEEIVISNQELTSSRIRNFKKLQKRRIVFHIAVTYDTPLEKMKKIPGIIEKIITTIEKVDFDRAHFASYNDWALTYEIVYYVASGEYNLYMDINQEILFQIRESFDKEGISMAFPTRTVHLVKEGESIQKSK